MDRLVALKVIAPRFMANAAAVERFQREVRAAARLGEHPNIVTAYDAEAAGQTHFLVMEYVEGQTWRPAEERGPLPVAEACDYHSPGGPGPAARPRKGHGPPRHQAATT